MWERRVSRTHRTRGGWRDQCAGESPATEWSSQGRLPGGHTVLPTGQDSAETVMGEGQLVRLRELPLDLTDGTRRPPPAVSPTPFCLLPGQQPRATKGRRASPRGRGLDLPGAKLPGPSFLGEHPGSSKLQLTTAAAWWPLAQPRGREQKPPSTTRGSEPATASSCHFPHQP